MISMMLTLWLATTAGAQTPVKDDPEPGALEPGVSLRVYDVGKDMSAVPSLVPGQTANVNRLIKTIDVAEGGFGLNDRFFAEVDGFLLIAKPGDYLFRLASDDGSRLWIGGKEIVNNDGMHAMDTTAQGKATLRAGRYELKLVMFENTGTQGLRLEWRPPGAEQFSVVPAEVLRTEADQVRVTSPGEKQFKGIDGGSGDGGGGMGRVDGVHPAFDLVDIRPDDFEPKVGGMAFLPDGRLAICTWDADGAVYFLSGVTGSDFDPKEVKVHRFAAGLAEPLGLNVVEGEVYVLQKQELTRLVDRDGDDVADSYIALADSWPVSSNFHEFAFGLPYKNGKFYLALAVAINPGGATTKPQVPGRGTVISVDRETGKVETVAAGFRTPNGIGLGPDDELFQMDNQGGWRPASAMYHVMPGHFYGHYIEPPHPLETEPATPPALWLPQGEIGNSPSQPILVTEGVYKGQMLHGDVTHGGIKRDFLEKVDGVWQGAVFRFTQGMPAGPNRLAWGPDGHLYIGMLGSSGNWGSGPDRYFGLSKLVPNDKTAFEPLAVRVTPTGFDITFTQPLAPSTGGDASTYRVRQWTYQPTAKYGGPKIDQRTLDVTAANVSPDRRRVTLTVDGLKEGYVHHITVDRSLTSEAGDELWTNEAWYTLNRLPR